ncbi:MAG: cyclase [Actinobacteria bacterium]|nr:cyclase [Actinomycetota bacterium]NIS29802.1 cyclase [Actinomycetota bacterium]NIT94713.1 cyclase [Actinomycetota bacterium]NIU18343.1 cyclase [Actinomycetota bacterium]NIU65105.1 cyclase [Actinomycetota bacterium]
MVDQATERTTIQATPEECYAAVVDFERYPEWASDIKLARILSRDDDGRAVDVEYRAAAMGRSTTYTLRYFYGSNPRRIAWRLQEGDVTRRLDGEYEFLPVSSEPGSTEVIYHLAVDLKVPLPGFVKRRAEARIVRTALDELKRHVESGSAA